MRAAVFLFALTAVSCLDPVHTDQVNALGDEVAGIPTGPTHRAGQPCTVCHGDVGPGSPQFVAAGTVYDTRGSVQALSGVSVTLTDRNAKTFTTQTNVVGNFYITTEEWAPTFPLLVDLQYGDTHKAMQSTIGRDGGCGYCHQGQKGDALHQPAVFLKEIVQ